MGLFDLMPKNLMIKAILPMIDEYLPLLDTAFADYKNQLKKSIQITEKEDLILMFWEVNKLVYVCFGVITEDNHIRLQLETSLFTDFVIKIISQLKKPTADAVN